MESIIRARGLRKRYGKTIALDGVDLDIKPGRIVGLIGPNGAGKTTALKGILGLAQVEGSLEVLGMQPAAQRTQLLEQVSFIADTAILPRWLKVRAAVDYVANVHPRFDRARAEAFLANTRIKSDSRIGALSKGMVTQLHLALIMAIDSKLLVLDEPTLGLDIIYRKQFYTTLLNDYFDEGKTILVTTHQVEEIEALLTDLIFINQGKIVLDTSMDSLAERFVSLQVTNPDKAAALALNPISVNARLGGHTMIFEGVAREQLAPLGSLHTPSVSDLFVAKIQSSHSWGQAQEHAQ